MKTIEFLNKLCEQADAKRKGSNDWSGMRIIASNRAVQYYFDNVWKMGVNPQGFTYTGMFAECVAFHKAYEDEEQKTVESEQRISTLEAEVKRLSALLAPIVENAQQTTDDDAPAAEPVEEEPKPRKKARKDTGTAEPEAPAAEPDAEEDADAEEPEEVED